MPCKCTRKQSETNFLSAITARTFQSNAALFTDTAAPTPPTDNKTLHYCVVLAKDVRAATPTRFVCFRSRGNKNASRYKKRKVENIVARNQKSNVARREPPSANQSAETARSISLLHTMFSVLFVAANYLRSFLLRNRKGLLFVKQSPFHSVLV